MHGTQQRRYPCYVYLTGAGRGLCGRAPGRARRWGFPPQDRCTRGCPTAHWPQAGRTAGAQGRRMDHMQRVEVEIRSQYVSAARVRRATQCARKARATLGAHMRSSAVRVVLRTACAAQHLRVSVGRGGGWICGVSGQRRAAGAAGTASAWACVRSPAGAAGAIAAAASGSPAPHRVWAHRGGRLGVCCPRRGIPGGGAAGVHSRPLRGLPNGGKVAPPQRAPTQEGSSGRMDVCCVVAVRIERDAGAGLGCDVTITAP